MTTTRRSRAHAAVGMRHRLRTVGRLQTSSGLVVLRISMGLHSGTFHAFAAASSHRELVIAGPAATATVEAEGTATAGEIVMSARRGRGAPGALPGPGARRGLPAARAGRTGAAAPAARRGDGRRRRAELRAGRDPPAPVRRCARTPSTGARPSPSCTSTGPTRSSSAKARSGSRGCCTRSWAWCSAPPTSTR